MAAKWILAEQHSDTALALYERETQAGQGVVALPLLPIEVTNILRQRVRRTLLTPADAARALDLFLTFPVRLLTSSQPHTQTLDLANQYDLPAAYDAYYLALAAELGVVLWTADERLLRVLAGKLPFVHWIGDYAS